MALYMESHIADIVPLATGGWEDLNYSLLVFSGCNFRCSYCYNSPILDTKEEHKKNLKEIKKELERCAPFVDGLMYCGAEPTLQRQTLLTIGKWARELGLKIGIETNGSRPDVLKELIQEQLLDHVVLDVKTPFDPELFTKVTKVTTLFKPVQETLTDIKETIEFLTTAPVTKVVRTTIIPTLMYRKEHLEEIARSIYVLGCVWELQPFVAKGTVHQRLRNIHSPSEEFLNDLQNVLQQRYPMLKVRVKNPMQNP